MTALVKSRPEPGLGLEDVPEPQVGINDVKIRVRRTGICGTDLHIPIVPLIVWGAQRLWTKDHPRSLGRNKIPITVSVGEQIQPTGTSHQLDAAVRESMTALLHRAQEEYPHPAGAYWVPRRLGGSAPTMAEAKVLDKAELEERARKQAEREARSRR